MEHDVIYLQEAFYMVMFKRMILEQREKIPQKFPKLPFLFFISKDQNYTDYLTLPNASEQLISKVQELAPMFPIQLNHTIFTFYGIETGQKQLFFIFSNGPINYKVLCEGVGHYSINFYRNHIKDYYSVRILVLFAVYMAVVVAGYIIFLYNIMQIKKVKNNIISVFSFIQIDCINVQIEHCKLFSK